MCLLPSSEDRTTDVISQAKKKLKEFFDSFRPDFISYSGTGIIRELFKVTRTFKRKEETNKQTKTVRLEEEFLEGAVNYILDHLLINADQE